MKFLPLVSALLLTQCIKSPESASRPAEDKSIVFPSVLSLGSTTPIDEQGKMYELDGVTLQALRVATQDFLPHGSQEGPCWRRPEGHRYVIIRKDNIIFVQIYADTESCMRGLMMLDYGGEYAISTDGRILRRRLPGDPDDSPVSQTSQPDDGGLPPGEDYSAVLGSTTLSSRIALPPSWLDAGPRRHTGACLPAPEPSDWRKARTCQAHGSCGAANRQRPSAMTDEPDDVSDVMFMGDFNLDVS